MNRVPARVERNAIFLVKVLYSSTWYRNKTQKPICSIVFPRRNWLGTTKRMENIYILPLRFSSIVSMIKIAASGRLFLQKYVKTLNIIFCSTWKKHNRSLNNKSWKFSHNGSQLKQSTPYWLDLLGHTIILSYYHIIVGRSVCLYVCGSFSTSKVRT